MKKILALYKSNLLVTLRNRQAFFFSIIFPLIFIGVFGIAFQESSPGNRTIPIGIINKDMGVPDNLSITLGNGSVISGTYFSEQYIKILKEITFEDNETKIFDVTLFSNQDDAQIELEKQKIYALVLIPENFSEGMLAAYRRFLENLNPFGNYSGYPPSNFTTSVVVKGDQTLIDFSIAGQVVKEVLNQFMNFGREDPISVNIDGDISSRGLTTFDYIVPGLFIYAILNNLGTVATIALSDVQSGLLSRLRLTKVKPFEYLLALIFSQVTLSLLQVPIMFGAAAIFGFPLTLHLIYAFLFSVVLALGISGIGVFVAGLVKDADTVGALAAIIGTPMAFLAGAFFDVPNPVLVSSSITGTDPIRVLDFLPATPAISGLRLILLANRTLSETWFSFLLLIIDSIFFLVLGILVYSKKHFSTK